MFVEKALRAQQAGAMGVVVINTDTSHLMSMGSDQMSSQTNAPAVLIGADDGGALLKALDTAQEAGGGVRLRLFAPPLQAAGSSASGSSAQQQPHPRRQQQQQQAKVPVQQAELLMSPHAQLWLFNKVAGTGADPSTAFEKILEQIQAYFAKQEP
jgi:hypothetical protein